MRTSRFLAILIFTTIVLCAHPAWAQSTTILDAFEVIDPGITLTLLHEGPTPSASDCASLIPPVECGLNLGSSHTVLTGLGPDAAGNLYRLTTDGYFFGFGKYGSFLQRVDHSLITTDMARVYSQWCYAGGCTANYTNFTVDFYTDIVNGRILAHVLAQTCQQVPCNVVDSKSGFVEISGLPKMFDVALTYVPQTTLSILTPDLPDGFGSADSLQVWAGDTRTLPDWSKAVSLACPAASRPSPGATVRVADALPAPDLGHATYYVVATQKGSERRLGRQYTAGAFSARNPAALPACP